MSPCCSISLATDSRPRRSHRRHAISSSVMPLPARSPSVTASLRGIIRTTLTVCQLTYIDACVGTRALRVVINGHHIPFMGAALRIEDYVGEPPKVDLGSR